MKPTVSAPSAAAAAGFVSVAAAEPAAAGASSFLLHALVASATGSIKSAVRREKDGSDRRRKSGRRIMRPVISGGVFHPHFVRWSRADTLGLLVTGHFVSEI